MTPIIKTEKLTHIYSTDTPFEHAAVRGLDFEAAPGEFIGIIGRTGSGKSTFIQHLNGLLKPTFGRVLFNGEDIWAAKGRARGVRFKVGLVFQYPEYQLFEETVYRDIAFGPRNMGLDGGEVDLRVREAAEFVGLEAELLEKSPFELSGGQKRRAAIAGVMAMRPELLILDEPTAGLDPAGRSSVLENICNYHKKQGKTVILVTHSMEEIARVAGRIVVMNRGGIVMDGCPAEVFSRAGELGDIGLSVPEVTRIMLRLRELGLDVNASVYTIEQAVDALMGLKEVRGNA